MIRVERREIIERHHHLVGHELGVGEACPAVDDAVPDGADVAQVTERRERFLDASIATRGCAPRFSIALDVGRERTCKS